MNKSSNLQNSLMLAPLIGASDSLVKALGLMVVFLCVSSLFGLGMSALRPRLAGQARLGASVLLSATLTGCAVLAAQAWAFELQQQLALYLGLIAVQCVVLEQQDFFQRPVRLRFIGLFCLLLVILGALREALGSGSIGHRLPWLLGMNDVDWPGWVLSAQGGLHLLTFAPGGFILLGLLLAARQAWAVSSTSHRPPSRK
ncbi:Rnf-Nqr domain containing protein [Pseudomonas sp. NFIX28]|uniref:Rnf-Nqr domain containing protein n=1 Tax=Pseudomonas sp. NFIX28 TaxID=1566235 RepID=UPI0008990B82|nr:Rnf-Nqr domain containing protein [Pseudomonas sp. NFIX28]SDZ21480.1 electron transport complex protein RnfE [Pseudomonas sp. NFIX28]